MQFVVLTSEGRPTRRIVLRRCQRLSKNLDQQYVGRSVDDVGKWDGYKAATPVVRMNLFILKTWLETKLSNDERGASMVEYILLVALIARSSCACAEEVLLPGSQCSNSGT